MSRVVATAVAFLRVALCAALLVLMQSCALSPQTVVVKPDVRVASMPIGRSRPVAVTTRDQRRDTSLGARGGLYTSAELTTDERMVQSINQEVVTVLQSWDYAAVPASMGNSGMPAFVVEVLSLDYQRPASTVAGDVTVKCRIAVRVEKGSAYFEGEYSSRRTEQVPVMPTAEVNKRLVNETVSQALQRMFQDPKLQRFMADY
jgi:uncharacterized lipoprotein YajG